MIKEKPFFWNSPIILPPEKPTISTLPALADIAVIIPYLQVFRQFPKTKKEGAEINSTPSRSPFLAALYQ